MKAMLELNRRRWLRDTALGAMGGGLFVAAAGGQQPNDAKDDDQPDLLTGEKCPQVMKLSKRISGGYQFSPIEPCPCRCDVGAPDRIDRVNYKAELRLIPFEPCDETHPDPLLPPGSRMLLEGTLALRLTRCREANEPAWIGCNRAKFRIERGDEAVFAGTLCGTEGFLPTAKEGERCCSPTQGLGSLCGEGVGRLKGWLLNVSYHSMMQGLTQRGLCEQRAVEVQMNLDGVLIGPCERIG